VAGQRLASEPRRGGWGRRSRISRGDANKFDVLGGTPFRITPYRYHFQKSQIPNPKSQIPNPKLQIPNALEFARLIFTTHVPRYGFSPRTVRDPLRHRRRRHGRGLSRVRYEVQARCCDQGHPVPSDPIIHRDLKPGSVPSSDWRRARRSGSVAKGIFSATSRSLGTLDRVSGPIVSMSKRR
jgi:hypothetical protein